MQVEAKKSFTHGFVLTEAEFRRTVETIADQFKKLAGSPTPSQAFKLKYRNGAIADTTSLDEILAQENLGSSQIIRLSMLFAAKSGPDDVTVSIEFVNVDIDEEPGYTSIRFTIRGDSRDWVFVTSTLLEERMTKVKRFALNQIGAKGPPTSPLRLLLPIIVAMALTLPVMYLAVAGQSETPLGAQLSEAKKAGKVIDPIDALIFLEQRRAERLRLGPKVLYPFAILTAGMVGLMLVWLFFVRYYLVYNFCWGDYADYFQKREVVRRYVLVVVITGLVVSFAGGILANRWRW